MLFGCKNRDLCRYIISQMTDRDQVQSVSETLWPKTPEGMDEVRAQLDRMLNDPLFNQSRRYPRLLRRIVEDSLAGRIEHLKERVLGIELFERAPDYDTNADAIVRVTAAEIRKRIAQYYHEKDHYSELRIDLPVGGYVAEFSVPKTEAEPQAESVVAGATDSALVGESAQKSHQIRRHWRWVFAVGVLAVLLIALSTIIVHFGFDGRSQVDAFWAPFIANGARPILCVGQLPVDTVAQGPQNSLARTLLGQRPVSISDAVVVSDYATYLGTKMTRPRIQVSTATTYADLRQHPVLLIGGLDNNWTMRFLDGLRYRMASTPNNSVLQIYDSTNPSAPRWSMDFAKPPEHVVEDYAIVARIYEPATESIVVIAAGLGENGTAAADDFLLHSQYLSQIDPKSRVPWKDRNMELVIKTQIIDGNAGPPVIVARYYW